jgi:hypothetical protein
MHGINHLKINWILPSSVLLLGVRWFKNDVSGLTIGPIFKDQAVQEERPYSRNNPEEEEFISTAADPKITHLKIVYTWEAKIIINIKNDNLKLLKTTLRITI